MALPRDFFRPVGLSIVSGLLMLLLILSTLGDAATAKNKSQAPNIIIMVVDDLGWDDVSFHGSEIHTPNIDRLANEGVMLTNYYTLPICTPTRSAIMTGYYPIHTGLQHGTIRGSEPYGLPLKFQTIANHLKQLDYSTHAIGKWHLGFYSDDYIPESRGFDTFLGHYQGHGDYMDHHIHFDNFEGLDLHYKKQALWNYSEVYSTEIFANHAKNIIETHDQSAPLFMYYAQQAVHAADYDDVQSPQKYIDRFPYITNRTRRYFAGVASAVDDSVGVLFQALEDAGMADNTVFVFTTDNGGPTNGREGNAACNWPLRGSKATTWQGGIQGVSFVHSPLLQKRGYVNDQLLHCTDWLPTLVSLAARSSPTSGQRLETLRRSLDAMDGVDQWDVLSRGLPTRRTEALVNIEPFAHYEGIILGNFKLLIGETENRKYDGWYPPPKHMKPPKASFAWEIGETPTRPSNGSGKDGEGVAISFPGVDVMSKHDGLDGLAMWMEREYEKLAIEREPGGMRVMDVIDENGSATGRKTIKIHCGEKPANASTNCELYKSPCLFHLKSDPCEYMNIADRVPSVVAQLQKRIDYYRQSMVRPLNKKPDPKGNPALHGGVWMPWR